MTEWRLIICQKTFNLDEGFDIGFKLTKDEMEIVKDYLGIEGKNDRD